MGFENIFSLSVPYLFISLTVSFTEQSFLILTILSLSVLSFLYGAFDVASKGSLLYPRSSRFFPMFSSKSFLTYFYFLLKFDWNRKENWAEAMLGEKMAKNFSKLKAGERPQRRTTSAPTVRPFCAGLESRGWEQNGAGVFLFPHCCSLRRKGFEQLVWDPFIFPRRVGRHFPWEKKKSRLTQSYVFVNLNSR